MILPGQVIGILGGGQLGRMIILEGRKMGFRFITLDPTPHCPAAQVADQHIQGEYHDLDVAKQLADQSDLILYEFENIDPALVQQLESLCNVPQGSQLLEITRHRLREKEVIDRAGIPVTPYHIVKQKSDIIDGFSVLGEPVVLKTTTGGYDGKGQWLIHSRDDVEKLPDTMFLSSTTYILEQFIPFEREISVVVARSRSGEIKAFPPTINIHRNHILHLSVTPVDRKTDQKATKLAIQVAEALEVVGLLAVEMFNLPDGRLLVNETAPRPHNSGHYTYDACQTSQFEQMLRACIGLSLHATELHVPAAAMVNLLGEHQSAFFTEIAHLPPNAKIHWYGKTAMKTGRKVGHITLLGESVPQLIHQIEEIPIWSRLTSEEKETLGL